MHSAFGEMAQGTEITSGALPTGAAPLEMSVVMPCLNEAETLKLCIVKAQQAMRSANIRGEVIVADNGSADGSQQLALECGARVVSVEPKGYGSALRGGIEIGRASCRERV